jgi:thioredoxin-dependent peroxiredoxin
VIGVSGDSQETNERFRKSLDLPFPLVGDPEETILRAYRVRWPLLGLAQRVTYAIGQDGRVLLAFHSELNLTAHAAKACEALARPA